MINYQFWKILFYGLCIGHSYASNKDLEYNKLDRLTPSHVNDDHMVVKKIKKREYEKLSVSGGNIYFEKDKYIIAPTEHIKLEEISKAILRLNNRVDKIIVEGFASIDGDNIHNFDLGMERAKAVKKALIKLGIEVEMFETYSYGEESMYKFANINKNRRTQIKIKMKSNE